jgi:mannose-6-phosphate isomerase-like protein (cupin superfamily)
MKGTVQAGGWIDGPSRVDAGRGRCRWFGTGFRSHEGDERYDQRRVLDVGDDHRAGLRRPPPHSHKELTDTFYVLEGTLTIRAGERFVEVPAGGYVLIPPGVVHTFSNASESNVRFLNLNPPGGWENYLRGVEKLMAGGRRPDPDEWRTVMSKYDFVPAG